MTNTVIEVFNGTLVTSTELNRSIGGMVEEVRLLTEPYTVPDELSGLLSHVVARARERDPNLFNGECVRMCSDMDAGEAVVLQRAHYFDGLCANEVSRYDRFTGLLMSEDGALVPLSQSVLANLVGTSTLAVTEDEHMVLTLHGNTVSSPGLYAPSGSGSLDIGDVTEDLSAFVIGAVRELHEECGLREDDVASSVLAGMGRWVEHGGKPEFSSLTFLKVSSDDVASITGDTWTHKVVTVPFDVSKARRVWSGEGCLVSAVSRGEVQPERVSLPLEFAARAAAAILRES